MDTSDEGVEAQAAADVPRIDPVKRGAGWVPPGDERPKIFYSPQHKLTFVRQPDGTYKPTGPTQHD